MIPAVPQTNLPPALVVGALYDSFLQAALRQFFSRATFETEPMLSASSDGRLAIEPTDDPSVMYVRWFGTRYGLRVPPARPFTPHEIRLAKSIGSVLGARYHAILNPKAMVERGELFRGAIEDRYVGTFAEGRPYPLGAGETRADRIASAIEVLRVAALSSYENRAISTGVLILGGDMDPRPSTKTAPVGKHEYSQALTAVKAFFRLVDGQRTLFLAGRDGKLIDIVDVKQWADVVCGGSAELPAPVPASYAAHARATLTGNHVCVVLSPSGEIKLFAEGAQVLAFRHAHWHLLDLRAKFEQWAEAVQNRPLAERLFQSALDLADARQGALFVVLRDPADAVPKLVASMDRAELDQRRRGADARRADQARSARPRDGAVRDGARAHDPRRAGVARRRDRHRRQRPFHRGRRDPPPRARAGRRYGHRRRSHDGGDDGQPLRSGPQGQRGRAHQLLRQPQDLGYLGTDAVGSFELTQSGPLELTRRVRGTDAGRVLG